MSRKPCGLDSPQTKQDRVCGNVCMTGCSENEAGMSSHASAERDRPGHGTIQPRRRGNREKWVGLTELREVTRVGTNGRVASRRCMERIVRACGVQGRRLMWQGSCISHTNMHKKAAWCLLIGGFVWISVICVELFDAPHRGIWKLQSERLPAGDLVPRKAAVDQLRSLQRSIDTYYSQLFIAGLLMLIGGVVNGIAIKQKSAEQNASPNSR